MGRNRKSATRQVSKTRTLRARLGGTPRVKRYQIIMAYFNIGINRLIQSDKSSDSIIN